MLGENSYDVNEGVESAYRVREKDIMHVLLRAHGSCCDESDTYWLGNQCYGTINVYLNFTAFFANPKGDALSASVAAGTGSFVTIAEGETPGAGYSGQTLRIKEQGGRTSTSAIIELDSFECSEQKTIRGKYSIYLFDSIGTAYGSWLSLYTINYEITNSSCGEISAASVTITAFGGIFKPGRDIEHTFYENKPLNY